MPKIEMDGDCRWVLSSLLYDMYCEISGAKRMNPRNALKCLRLDQIMLVSLLSSLSVLSRMMASSRPISLGNVRLKSWSRFLRMIVRASRGMSWRMAKRTKL